MQRPLVVIVAVVVGAMFVTSGVPHWGHRQIPPRFWTRERVGVSIVSLERLSKI